MTKIKINIKLISKQIVCGFLAVALLLAYFPNMASAAQITGRKATMGSSVINALTTYTFNFTLPSATPIKSVSFAACTTPTGACTAAPGFANPNASVLASQPTGLDGSGLNSGWVVSTGTLGELRLSKAAATLAPSGPQSVSFSNVKNPSTANTTFYLRISTFTDALWNVGNVVDTGTIAASTAGQITVTAAVNETLTFTLADATVALGTLTASSTGANTSAMTVATNATGGYSVSYSGNTLTYGTDTIAAMTTAGASVFGSVSNLSQFGINLKLNTTPAIGANVTTGTNAIGAPTANYNTANTFKFLPAGEAIASSTGPSNANTFTTSYIANISSVTPAGSYQTAITYVATANF